MEISYYYITWSLIGVVALFLIILVVLCCCFVRVRKKKEEAMEKASIDGFDFAMDERSNSSYI